MTVPIPDWSRDDGKSRVPPAGSVEIGLHYERGENVRAYRNELNIMAAQAVHAVLGYKDLLDERYAEVIIELIDAKIVLEFGDRPRFIEVQVYAPRVLGHDPRSAELEAAVNWFRHSSNEAIEAIDKDSAPASDAVRAARDHLVAALNAARNVKTDPKAGW